jgi:hypothetical protein
MFDLQVEGVPETTRAFLVVSAGLFSWLDGISSVLYTLNDGDGLDLRDDEVLGYLRFFFFAVRGSEGPFILVEDPDSVTDMGAGVEALGRVRSALGPMTFAGRDPDGRFCVDASAAYGGAILNTRIAVKPDGKLEIPDIQVVAELDGLSVPEYPPLTPPLQDDP